MSNAKYVFTRKAGESFTFSAHRQKELEPQLIAAHDATKELHGTRRVHPDIKAFAAAAWDDMAQRLQFETQRPYVQCSREVARRYSWVYLARGAQGDFSKFDVDLEDVQR